jgi:exonuclease SbcC
MRSGRAQSDLFRYTSYLQQSNLRDLVKADSATLGAVIRTLAIDEGVYRLERALSDANISRTNREYAAVKKRLDTLASEANEVRARILETQTTIKAVEASGQNLESWSHTLAAVGSELGVSAKVAELTTDAILTTTDALDRAIQAQLTNAIASQKKAEQQLRQCADLKARQAEGDTLVRRLENLAVAISDAETKLSQLESELAELRSKLETPEFATVRTEQRVMLVRALELITALQDLRICPVCDREYQDLTSHIATKVQRLRAEQSQMQQAARALQTDIDFRENEKRLLAQNVAQMRREVSNIDVDARRLEQERQQLLATFTETIGSESSWDDISGLAQQDLDRSRAQREKLVLRATELSDIRSAVSATKVRSAELRKRVTGDQVQLTSFDARLLVARAAHERLDVFIGNAQEVRRRLSAGIEDVISSFALGSAKESFEELFRRLAKNPFFNVTVSSAKVRRHTPEVDWHAIYGGREFPGYAVFSQGELNSCAIAFFLALATSHPSSLKFMVLDDPVQNMDEIHIEEFGNVLKFMKDILGYQIVVALHDESVYQFFKRQLHPTSKEQSLISYSFEPTDGGAEILKDTSADFDPSAFVANVA